MRIYTAFALGLVVATLSACNGDHHTVVTTVTTSSSSSSPSEPIVLRAVGHPDAQIASSGGLTIAKSPVDLTDNQRTLLQKFYVTFQLMYDSDRTQNDGAAKPLYQNVTKTKAQAETACHSLSTMIADQEREMALQITSLQPYLQAQKDEASSCTNI